MSIFEERKSVLPYEYPELISYAEAIHASFWEPRHFTYEKDVRDFKIELNDSERQVIKRSMLAISVVENKVKTFWARIDNRMPKTEISDVGHTFGGNEVIHRLTYAKLIELLGLENEFKNIDQVPCMEDRITYLTKYLKGVSSRSNKEFTKSLILFTLLVENCALFMPFLTISSFGKYKNTLKNFSKVINATAREEIIHGKFGAHLVSIIRKENPEWFDQDMEDKIRRAVRKAYKAESEVLDWIFEDVELDHISKPEILEYLKHRLNDSLSQMGYEKEYEVYDDLLKKSQYMETMLLSTGDIDFFDGKVIDYDMNNTYEEDDLW
jgi:ribonucleoside-diphosphate reductase beta chain